MKHNSSATLARCKRQAGRELKQERIELRMVLTGADRDAFLNSLLNPPEPTDKLVAALKRHREAFG